MTLQNQRFTRVSFLLIVMILLGCQSGFRKVNGAIPKEIPQTCSSMMEQIQNKWKKSTTDDFFKDYYLFNPELFNRISSERECFLGMEQSALTSLLGNPTQSSDDVLHYLLYRKNQGRIEQHSLDFHLNKESGKVTMVRSDEVVVEFD